MNRHAGHRRSDLSVTPPDSMWTSLVGKRHCYPGHPGRAVSVGSTAMSWTLETLDGIRRRKIAGVWWGLGTERRTVLSCCCNRRLGHAWEPCLASWLWVGAMTRESLWRTPGQRRFEKVNHRELAKVRCSSRAGQTQ
jgi:hypothetical protein